MGYPWTKELFAVYLRSRFIRASCISSGNQGEMGGRSGIRAVTTQVLSARVAGAHGATVRDTVPAPPPWATAACGPPRPPPPRTAASLPAPGQGRTGAPRRGERRVGGRRESPPPRRPGPRSLGRPARGSPRSRTCQSHGLVAAASAACRVRVAREGSRARGDGVAWWPPAWRATLSRKIVTVRNKVLGCFT